MSKFTEADLLLWEWREHYLLEILNGNYPLDSAREDLQSLVVARDKEQAK